MLSIAQRRIFDWLNAEKEVKADQKNQSQSEPLSSRSTKQLVDYDLEKKIFDWVQEQLPVQVSSSAIREEASKLYREKGHKSIKCSYGWYRRWANRFQPQSGLHEETDNVVLSWVLQQYDQNHAVSYAEVQNYAEKNLTKMKPEFQASMGWVKRFFKRHLLLLNLDDDYGGQLPPELDTAVDEFLQAFYSSNKYKPECIGCMDEIPISFTEFYSSNKNQVPSLARMKKYGIANCDATVILALRADGILLPAFVIINGLNPCDSQPVCPQNSVVVHYCQSTEPTMTCLEKWHDSVWLKTCGIEGEQTLLLMDNYSLHHHFKEKYTSNALKVELFPLGCSCKLQPLNCSIRRKFLKFMESFWMAHLKPCGVNTAVQLPSTDEIILWVSESYEKLKQEKETLSDAFFKMKLLQP